MRIIQGSQNAAAAPVSSTAPAEPGVSKEQFESLENIARALLQKLERVEERLNALEAAPPREVSSPARIETPPPATVSVVPFPVIAVSVEPSGTPAPAPASATPIPLTVETIKKDLFSKMWKYMNDESAKAV